MSKLQPGWADRAGAEAGATERCNYAVTQPSARRPAGWKPGTIYHPTTENVTRGSTRGKASRRADRSLDQALGKPSEEGAEE